MEHLGDRVVSAEVVEGQVSKPMRASVPRPCP